MAIRSRKKSCCHRIPSGNSCVNLSVSTIVGWGGIAPIIVKRCTRAAAFAPVAADEAGAELAADGAAEVAEGVWLWGADSLLGWDEGASGVSVGGVIICAGTTGAGAGITGVETADVTLAGLSGLTGLVGLVGFVTDLTQAFEEVIQSPHKG